jgi:hypothetical protein
MTHKIFTKTSCSRISAPLSDNRLHYSTRNLTTLKDLFIIDMSFIEAICIEELPQALGQSVELAQHLLANHHFTETAMVVDHDCLRQQCDQESTT